RHRYSPHNIASWMPAASCEVAARLTPASSAGRPSSYEAGILRRPWRSPRDGEEAVEAVERAVDDLPPGQRTVITLRDIQGCESAEVCDVLGISEGNQRVLLHRARSKVRAHLEQRLQGEKPR